MANIPEFISVLRRIRDVIYPEVEEMYENTAILKNEAEQSKNAASASALASASSATIATTKSNEIKNVSAQSNTLPNGSLATVSYNPTDGKFTFGLPVGAKGDKGESYTINATGTTAGRAAYDTQSTGFSFLDISLSIVYFKLSATSGDWSVGTSFGKGENGESGEDGTGITSVSFYSTTSLNGLASQPGGIDTYRITLSNSNTYDISLTNGSDLNINGYTEKETLSDADEFAIADSTSSFSLKKLSFSNLKDWLKTLFIQRDYVIITGSATFSPTLNTIVLTEIGSLGLKIGDVIKIMGSTGNNKTFNVEHINGDGSGLVTDNNTIIVNYQHRGTSTPIPSKRLTAEISPVSITLITNPKEYEGLDWCIPASGRAAGVTYTNNIGRTMSIALSVSGQNCSNNFTVNGISLPVISINGTSGTYSVINDSTIVATDRTYSATVGGTMTKLVELR